MKTIKSVFSMRNGILYRETIKKVMGKETILNKDDDEKVIVFQLKNGGKIVYLLDKITLADVCKRLAKGVCGVLRLGNSQERVDLNQVDTILVDGKPLTL